MSCPAKPVNDDAPGSQSGQASPLPAREGCPIPQSPPLDWQTAPLFNWEPHPQTDQMTALLSALTAQTAAINRLAASNEALVQAMAEGETRDAEADARPTYMDGKPAR